MKLTIGFNCCIVDDVANGVYGKIAFASVSRLFIVGELIEIVLNDGKVYQFPYQAVESINGEHFESAKDAFIHATQYWN